MTSEDRGLLTLEQAARYLGVSKTSIRRWTKDGLLRCHRVGVRGERRFDRAMLDEFLLRRDAPPVAASQEAPLMEALQWLARDGRRRHVCLFFRDPIERWEAFRPY